MHYDAGLFHRFTAHMDTRVSIYCIVVDNYIVANSADTFHAESSYGYNMDEVRFSGVEAEFNAMMFERLSLFGNYTYRETDYDKEDILADAVLLQLAPKHKANLSLRYKWLKDALLTADIRYMGERKTEGDVYTLDGFTLVDIGVEQNIASNTTIHAYAGNIFGESYEEVYGFPMPKHTFGINIKMTFF